jgi:hypothetical protein
MNSWYEKLCGELVVTFQVVLCHTDNRRQKEEALNFRAKKENEVSAVEKVRTISHVLDSLYFKKLRTHTFQIMELKL